MAIQISPATRLFGLFAAFVFVWVLRRASLRPGEVMPAEPQSQHILVKGINTRVLAVPGSGPTVILLHGQAFQASTWLETGTLQALGGRSLRVLAIDLPGHGLTGGQPLPPEARPLFLQDLLQALHVQQPFVLVSPSMSGSYVLPWLAQHARELAGWVAVAPVGLQQAAHQRLLTAAAQQPQLKVLAIYGENDGMRSDYSLLEDALPRAQFLMIPGAGHACYLDSPDLFNRELLRFMESEVPGK